MDPHLPRPHPASGGLGLAPGGFNLPRRQHRCVQRAVEPAASYVVCAQSFLPWGHCPVRSKTHPPNPGRWPENRDAAPVGGGCEPLDTATAARGAQCCSLRPAAQGGRGLDDGRLLPCVFPGISSQLSSALVLLARAVLSPPALISDALCRSVDVIPDNPKFQQLQRELSQVLTQRQIHIQPDN